MIASFAAVWHWPPSELEELTADDLDHWLDANEELQRQRKGAP